MKKIITSILSLTTAIGLVSCVSYGTIIVTPDSKPILQKDDRLYLAIQSPDAANLHDVLEHKLLQAGFQLKPEIFIKNQDEYLTKAKKGKEKTTDFVLEYSYHSRKTFLIGRTVVDRFDARLIDFETKKKIFDMKFKGKRSVLSFADEFVKTLSNIAGNSEKF